MYVRESGINENKISLYYSVAAADVNESHCIAMLLTCTCTSGDPSDVHLSN